MSVEIDRIEGEYRSVRLRMTTSRGERFFVVVSGEDLTFYSDESSSGALSGKPLRRTADDLLDWVGAEGDKKPFRDRKQVKPRGGISSSGRK